MLPTEGADEDDVGRLACEGCQGSDVGEAVDRPAPDRGRYGLDSSLNLHFEPLPSRGSVFPMTGFIEMTIAALGFSLRAPVPLFP